MLTESEHNLKSTYSSESILRSTICLLLILRKLRMYLDFVYIARLFCVYKSLYCAASICHSITVIQVRTITIRMTYIYVFVSRDYDLNDSSQQNIVFRYTDRRRRNDEYLFFMNRYIRIYEIESRLRDSI